MAKIGSNPLSAPGDVFSVSSAPQATVGTRFESADGRVYRYAQFDPQSNLVMGNLLQGVIPVLNHQNIAVTTAVSAGSTSLGQLPSVVVTLGATAGTAGFYSNGYMVVNAGAGHLGQTYSVLTNTTAASSGTMVVYLGEPLQTALATSDKVCLVPNQYNGVIQMPTTVTGAPVGVALTNGTAGWFGYVQTRGIASVLSDATVAVKGASCSASVTTAGAVTATIGTSSFVVGDSLVAGVSAETRPVFLALE